MDNFGDRMKEYEAVSDIRLAKRLPIILRLDGNSFSKLTNKKKFDKPFDDKFYRAMCKASEAVMKYCSGAQVAYTQSDEITVLLRNDMTIDTQPFLGNRLQKICSLVASTASVAFNMSMMHSLGLPTQAIFDCRAFVLPPSEVNNAFLWRQKDAFKNAVQGIAYYGLSEKYGRKTAQKMLHGLSNSQQQELIFQELGQNVNDVPTKWKRGICVVRQTIITPIEELIGKDKADMLGKNGDMVERTTWAVDEEIPLFNQDPSYIGKCLADER